MRGRGEQPEAAPAGGKARRRLAYFLQSRGVGDGETEPGPGLGQPAPQPAASTLAALHGSAVAALQAPAPPAATPAWQFLGPSVITNGQTYGNSRVPVSGRVAA